jgi:predicted N-acetyltransferase YhbS
MPDQLDFHPASPDELVAAHKNVHDIWSKGLQLDAHVSARLNSSSHQRARWYVGCIDGQVVTSLGSYPTQFQLRGETVSGFAIGSVYTRNEFRGRGIAPMLIAWVENHERQQGAELAILYSDIKPAYYAAMGYRLCPSREGWCDLRSMERGEGASKLLEFDGPAQLDEMSAMYHGYHGAAPLSIQRPAGYWQVMFAKSDRDRYFWLLGTEGKHRAYARLTPDPHGYRISDYACADDDEQTLTDLYRTLQSAASGWNIQRLGGWMPDHPVAHECFEITDRSTEITMIKPLNPQLAIDNDLITATNRFCELDHV